MNIAQAIVLKAMRETSTPVSTKVVGLKKVITHANVAKKHAFMIAKGIVDVFPGCPANINSADIGKFYVHLAICQKVCEVANAPVKILHIKTGCFSYPSATYANKSDIPVYVVRYRPNPDLPEQMTTHEAVKEKDKKK